MSHMSAQQPKSSALPSADDPTRTIACVICQAVYSPSRWYEHLLLAPPIALESAFMGMCHFCFRCRRPACPQCWDDVHGICAQCGQESRLPFRRATAPLSSLLFTASRQAQTERVQPATVPFICLVPGKFDHPQADVVEEMTTAAMEAVERRRSEAPGPGLSGRQLNTLESKPSQELVASQRRGRKVEERVTPVEIEEMETLPGRANKGKRGWGRFFAAVFWVALVLVVLCIVAAYFSQDANAFISSTLHIDIRAEIAYLWQLITHLF
jgi:hypothetical protein